MDQREERMLVRQAERAREGFTVSHGTPMALWCPQCGRPHVDEGEWAHRQHRTHLCATCGHEWTPYDHATIGVPHGLLPGWAPPQTVATLESYIRQMEALTKSATTLVEGRTAKIVADHRDQPWGLSKPNLRGREYKIRGVFYDRATGISLWLDGLECAVGLDKIEILEDAA